MSTDLTLAELSPPPVPTQLRRVRSLLRWSSATAFAIGFPWVFPAIVVIGGATQAPIGIALAAWLAALSAIGSVVWAHLISGPDEVRVAPSEWMLAIGGMGGNFLVAGATYAVASSLVGPELALALASVVPLSPLAILGLIPAMPLSMTILHAETPAQWASRLNGIAVVWITAQMIAAFTLGSVL